MRISLRHCLLAACWPAFCGAALAIAQEPEATPPAAHAQEPVAPPKPPALVIEAGTVHPVAGPVIADGVVVIDGERIVGIGKRGDVEIPAGAIVRSFPTGHVYPGLVDAATDAFTDGVVRNEAGVDAGVAIADVMQQQNARDDALIAAGITTAYVTARGPGLVRPQGAIVRPTHDTFSIWTERAATAVQMRLTNGPMPSHAFQRQQMLQQADALFDGLDEYRKSFADHKEALAKYQKEFDEYLAYHQKKKDGDKANKKDEAKPASPPADAAPAGPPEGRRPRGNRPPGGGGGGGEPPREPRAADPAGDDEFARAVFTLLDALAQDPPKQEPPKQEPKPAPQGPPAGTPPTGDKPAEKKDEAPKRPTYPKPPARDPQRDALLAVLDGTLPLRVEVHRADELRAAIDMQQKRTIPVLIVEQAYAAATVAPRLAERGVAAVITDVLPGDLPPMYDEFEPAALPAKLQAAGVPFAIATGSARRASLLPLMAATAVAHGLDREQALRAITLSAAEILGIAKDTGSLQKGKLADVLVSDRPLLATDSRVLFVLQAGRIEFEAK